MSALPIDFEFRCASKLSSVDFNEIKKWIIDLVIEYAKNLYAYELGCKLKCQR